MSAQPEALAGAPEPFRQTPASGLPAGPRHQPWCAADVPAGADRCPRCQVFQVGHPGPRLMTGWHSVLVRSGAATGQQDAIAAARLELRGELGDVGVVKGELADAFVELSAVRNYLGGRARRTRGGPKRRTHNDAS